MEPTQQVPTGGASAQPAPSASEAPTPARPRGGKKQLLAQKKLRQEWVGLSDGREYLIEALRPREIADINQKTLISVPVDPDDPENDEVKFQWDPMRPFYLVAKALMDVDDDGKPTGKRMYKSSMGEDDAYMAGANEIADFMLYEDVQTLLDRVQEISGMNLKNKRKEVGKDSGRTRSKGASSEQRS